MSGARSRRGARMIVSGPCLQMRRARPAASAVPGPIGAPHRTQAPYGGRAYEAGGGAGRSDAALAEPLLPV